VTEEPVFQNNCGTCIACCYALAFHAEEDGYKKEAGDMCRHCTGTGCGAYETRYKLCRLFNCAWRGLPQLGEEWRPDKSGVMMLEVVGDELPEICRASGVGLEFLILTDQSAIQRPGFAEYIATLVSRRVAVFLGLPGRPKTVINRFLEDSVAAKDIPGLTRMLIHIYHLHLEAKRLGIDAPEQAP
jgi:hypothetical protein